MITLIRVVIFLSIISVIFNSEGNLNVEKSDELEKETEVKENIILECDGITVIENCVLEGIDYELYLIHPEIKEEYHYEEKIVGYNEVITGYCTLCNDGTRSPSCSTGSGTCSHHGGVKEWNAPEYKSVPIYENIKIIDIEAKEEWLETILKN